MNLFEENLLDSCVDMVRNPNMHSELVRETMCSAIEIVRDRLKAIDSPILSLDITEAEYKKYYKELLIKHDIAHLENDILEDTNV